MDQLKICVSSAADIWGVPELDKPILKKLNTTVMNVFLDDLSCKYLGDGDDPSSSRILVNPANTLFENYIAEQCEELSEDVLFDIRPFEKVC